MNLVTDWQLEQAEAEHEQDILDWYYERTGKRYKRVTVRMEEYYEMEMALEHAMSKDD